MSAIPQQLNYAAGALNTVPELGTNSQSMVFVPSNGSTFSTDGAIGAATARAAGIVERSHRQPEDADIRWWSSRDGTVAGGVRPLAVARKSSGSALGSAWRCVISKSKSLNCDVRPGRDLETFTGYK